MLIETSEINFPFYYIAVPPTLCEAHRVGLVDYPTTLAPASGSVTVTTQCADNAHRSSSSLNALCSSSPGLVVLNVHVMMDIGQPLSMEDRYAKVNHELTTIIKHLSFSLLAGLATVCEARSVGLVHYPTTLAPASGSVTVTTQCADNAHLTNSCPNVECTSIGVWSGEIPQCECDVGYQAVCEQI